MAVFVIGVVFSLRVHLHTCISQVFAFDFFSIYFDQSVRMIVVINSVVYIFVVLLLKHNEQQSKRITQKKSLI